MTPLLLCLALVCRAGSPPQETLGRVEGSQGAPKKIILSDAQFRRVLDGLIAAGKRYQKTKGSKDFDSVYFLSKKLVLASTPARTPQLISALAVTGKNSDANPAIYQALAIDGDPAVVTPYFIKAVEGTTTGNWEDYLSTSYITRTYLMHDRDPRAADYLIAQLKNPKADRVTREEAYLHVAGTGGLKGAQAVLPLQKSRALLTPLSDRVLKGYVDAGEMGGRTTLAAHKTDASGHTWGLIENGSLGNLTDLWLVEKVNGRWTNAVFTGVSDEKQGRRFHDDAVKPKIAGLTGDQLLKKDWLTILRADPVFSELRDGSGLTPTERKRLGLVGSSADTDGDGDRDEIDPWPNAPKRELTDDEQILAAAFEARFHEDQGVGVMLFEALPDMKPFEMPGRSGPTIWSTESDPHKALQDCYGVGVGFLSFSEFDQSIKKPWPQRLIHWNADHSEAVVEINTRYGGLNGVGNAVRLRKFLGRWVVTSMDQTWVS